MKTHAFVAAGLLAILSAVEAHAKCLEGAIGGCQLTNGCPGESECVGGVWIGCEPVAGTKTCTRCGGVGTQMCNASGAIVSACTRPEACNGCDDDGDGLIDEGLQCYTPTPMLSLKDNPGFPWGALEWSSTKTWEDDVSGLYWPGTGGELAMDGTATGYKIAQNTEALLCPLPNFGGCSKATDLESGDGAWHTPSEPILSYELFPYNWDDIWSNADISVWPDDTEPVMDPGTSENMVQHLQGLAHDAGNWFVSKQTAIYKVPVSANLANESSVMWTAKATIPWQAGARNHIGDLDQYQGYVFAPFEGGDLTPLVILYRATDLGIAKVLRFPSSIQPLKAGWVAINPQNGKLYSGDTWNEINVYDWDVPGDELKYLYSITSTGSLQGNGNGVAFSPSGHMYIPYKTGDDLKLKILQPIGREVELLGDYWIAQDLLGPLHIFEGVDVWDTDTVSGKHPNLHGQVHILVLNWDAIDDNWSIYHADALNGPL